MRVWLTLTMLLLLIIGSPAYAASSQWMDTKEVRARLIAGQYDRTGAMLGLQFKLAEGWKIYWRTPGDAGAPVTLDASGSKNIKDIELLWPAPKRFVEYETIESFGYKDEVILPVIITPKDPAEPIKASITVNYAVCDDICLFLSQVHILELPAHYLDKALQAEIAPFFAKVPAKNGDHGLSIGDVSLSGDRLVVTTRSQKGFGRHPDLFVEGSQDFRFPQAELRFSDDKQQVVFSIPYEILLKDEVLAGKELTLTLTDDGRAVEKKITVPALSPVVPASIWIILLSAFLGGLILNVMPCVLPVLSIKLLHVVSHGGGKASRIRLSFIMTALGIVVSFLLLAFIVATLKTAGINVGWGFHFQEPLFLIGLVVLINVFAANLWGLFELQLPSGLNNLIYTKTREHDTTAAGDFLTGAFATLLATPCSAPFLGTAISFALSQGTQEIYLIFFFMGLGLATPYLLITLFPALASKMPKPGAWMVTVKHVMGSLLIATSVWLIWVLAAQLGELSAYILAVLSILLLFKLWVAKRFKMRRAMAVIIILLLVAGSFALPVIFSQKSDDAAVEETNWAAFDEAAIPKFVAGGRIVFVDVTADWCLTCKANKLLVLDTDEIRQAFKVHNVLAMEADYTSPSKEITDFLMRYNRYGIPFNIVYGPGAPDGIPLSELLRKKALLEALEKAR